MGTHPDGRKAADGFYGTEGPRFESWRRAESLRRGAELAAQLDLGAVGPGIHAHAVHQRVHHLESPSALLPGALPPTAVVADLERHFPVDQVWLQFDQGLVELVTVLDRVRARFVGRQLDVEGLR